MGSALISPGAIAREDLAGVAMGFVLDNPLQFAASTILPPVNVNKRNSTFHKIASSAMIQLADTIRLPSAAAKRGNYSKSTDTWSINEHAWEESVDPSNTDLYADPVTADEVATKRAMAMVLRDYERTVKTLLFNTSTWALSGTTGLSVSTPWATAASATPIADVNRGHDAIEKKIGVPGNTLIITSSSYRDLSVNANILGRIGYVSTDVTNGNLPLAMLASLFSVKRVVVVGGVYNSANEGLTSVAARVWGTDNAMLAHIHDSEDIEMPQLGRSFQLRVSPDSPGVDASGVENMAGTDVIVEEYAEPGTSSKIIRVKKFAGPKVINTDAAFLFGNLD